MQWAGLPPQALVPQPNPTVSQKHIRGPCISIWSRLQYCNWLPGCEEEIFSALTAKFDKQDYQTIDQLTRMLLENLSNWFGISKGIVDLIIQYAEEDTTLVRDGNFTMNLELPQDWAGF
jgi:hypothetical protein